MIVFNELIYEVVYLYDLRDLGTKDTLVSSTQPDQRAGLVCVFICSVGLHVQNPVRF